MSSSASTYLQMNGCNSVEAIRENAAKLCGDYLYGIWRHIQPEEMTLKKVSGGLSNLLYYCALPPDKKPFQNEPSRALLRIYGQVNGERAFETVITECIVFTLLSESQRGPRLFGVFPGGRLEEYIPARPLKTHELADPKLSALIAEKLVQIHQMDVPLNKQPRWFWKTTEEWIIMIVDNLQTNNEKKFTAMTEKIEKLQLWEELAWLREFLVAVDSPLVFCHNDLQEGNILLRQDNNEAFQRTNMTDIPVRTSSKVDLSSSKVDDECHCIADEETIPQNVNCESLVIIDFEYCSYNYRGFDIANHFNEWLYDYTNELPPFFYTKPEENHPTLAQKEHFIRNYLKVLQSDQNYKSHPNDTVEHLLAETEAFTLASHFFWGLWSLVNSTSSEISFNYWEYGEARFSEYFKQKDKHIKKSKEEPIQMSKSSESDN